MKFPLSLLLFTILTISLPAQKAPIKWGKIDPTDLKMTTYEQDPEAETVVLTDYATLRFDLSSGDIKYIIEQHIRIKIFKKSAFERGDISIPFYSYRNKETISSLKAKVYQADGTKFELSKNDVFEEAFNKYWSVKNSQYSMSGITNIQYK